MRGEVFQPFRPKSLPGVNEMRVRAGPEVPDQGFVGKYRIVPDGALE